MSRAEVNSDRLARTALIIPTRNAGRLWDEVLSAIDRQDGRLGQCLVIDSESGDDTQDAATAHGCELIQIRSETFDHGGTRQIGVRHTSAREFIIFLTQDAVLASPDALGRLLSAFDDPLVGAAFGRQLPRQEAGPLEAHARRFNYPMESRTSELADATNMGIKSAFLSNSFAAYRRTALESVGGFPERTILGEDMLTAARMLQNSWRIAYRADACVYHSHDYSIVQEFRRYFDTGVMHAREAWLIESFGKTEGEGLRYVKSELHWLIRHAPWLIPEALCRTIAKFTGYKLGRMERFLPATVKAQLSMHKNFWTRERDHHAS
ncbi:MAG: glycosyltransferase [Pseudomonadota bacterium]